MKLRVRDSRVLRAVVPDFSAIGGRLMEAGRDMSAAVLLAAGLSTRMGQTKALLPWDGRPLVAYQVAQLRAAGIDDIIVVTGHDGERVDAAARAAGARTVYNPAFAEGRAGSLRTGALAVSDTAAEVIVLNVDQPRPAALLVSLLEAHRAQAALITVPVYEGRSGHPPVLRGTLLGELRRVTEEEQGLRSVMRRHQQGICRAPVNDVRCLLDLNTPDAYEQARALFGLAG